MKTISLLISLCKKTQYFSKWVSENAESEADEVLKFKEFAFVNDCFQHKSNEAIGVFWRTFITLTLLLGSITVYAQVAINTDGSTANASAMLDIKSDTAGILIPRMTETQRDAITSPETGLLIYQNNNTPGFYFYNGSAWVVVGSEATDINSLADGKTGGYSVFLGSTAGNNDDGSNRYNVGVGFAALSNNTSGFFNTAIGNQSLFANTTGRINTSVGNKSLYSNTTGYTNTSVGHKSLLSNTTGWGNTAFGYQAGLSNTTGTGNVFIGYQAGLNETESNRLYISNSSTSYPLIKGYFNTGILVINGRVGIGTSNPNARARLDVSSGTKGFLPPRMNDGQMNAIASPPAGLMVYNTTYNTICFFDGTRWRLTSNGDGGNCGTISYTGQTYQTVIIGTQCWMAENLNIGTRIDGSDDQTNNNTIEKYCYDDDPANCDTYGGLYQWDEIMQYTTTEGTQGICPTGWHLPTDDEWKTMEMYLGMSQAQADDIGWRGTDEGGILKETGTIHWNSPNTGATNESGFTALPGGNHSSNGSFYLISGYCFWWSSSEDLDGFAWERALRYSDGQMRRQAGNETGGFSIRCLKN